MAVGAREAPLAGPFPDLGSLISPALALWTLLGARTFPLLAPSLEAQPVL